MSSDVKIRVVRERASGLYRWSCRRGDVIARGRERTRSRAVRAAKCAGATASFDIRAVIVSRLIALGRTPGWLASRNLGVNPTTVWRFLCGRSDIRSGTLGRILTELGLCVTVRE
jgi:hypothetical protein